ncbi:MAG: hypothetical protein M3R26_06880 [Actinomycetota bacterium]|nr:hypothetical protein [Actinomycetota bacterium]MDQ2982027.1 hypothetical protein [Actinomycetota bacterium]
MALPARHPFSLVIVFVAAAAMASVFIFARPAYHHNNGTTITLPAKHPANDASGAAGWVWQDGTPGWEPGYRVKGFRVAGVQPVELEAAQLAAARYSLDGNGVRVIASVRGSTFGVLAILAAPTLYQTPVKTCLAAMLEGDSPVSWQCPGAKPTLRDLKHSHVLLAATRYTWASRDKRQHPLYLVGIARGDVYRVVLHATGLKPQTLYTRGTTWGQFDAAVPVEGGARLKIYGRHGLVQTLPLNVPPGHQRVVQ